MENSVAVMVSSYMYCGSTYMHVYVLYIYVHVCIIIMCNK